MSHKVSLMWAVDCLKRTMESSETAVLSTAEKLIFADWTLSQWPIIKRCAIFDKFSLEKFEFLLWTLGGLKKVDLFFLLGGNRLNVFDDIYSGSKNAEYLINASDFRKSP